jgi:hypothetical protein
MNANSNTDGTGCGGQETLTLALQSPSLARWHTPASRVEAAVGCVGVEDQVCIDQRNGWKNKITRERKRECAYVVSSDTAIGGAKGREHSPLSGGAATGWCSDRDDGRHLTPI